MALTSEERSKQNKINGSHSKGPATPEGKLISRLNRLRMGLTAKVLTLPTENVDDVQAKRDAWRNHYQPQQHDEEDLVDRLALASLRLERIATAEAAIIAKQIETAEFDWKLDIELRLLDLTDRLRTEPARAQIGLMSFGAGIAWLLERWVRLHNAFEQFGCWNNSALIESALRLVGINPDCLSTEPVRGYELAVVAISCVPNYTEVPALTHLLAQMPPEWIGQYGTETRLEPEDAREQLGNHILSRIATLTALAEEFHARETRLLEAAKDRATVPYDTPQSRLLLRYMRSNELCMEKSSKMLQKLQSERQNAAKIASEEGSKPGLPNEPELVARTRSKQNSVGTCVDINDVTSEVVDRTDRKFSLCECVDMVAKPVSEVVPTPETVV
jgi:hypothetical protein